jgi:hypothetical protein
MSLTRYEIDGMKDEMYACSHGEWVKAEEAEARIRELEAKIERLTNRGIEDMKFIIAEQEARLRAADELAHAVEVWKQAIGGDGDTWDQMVDDWAAISAALTAYREASK